LERDRELEEGRRKKKEGNDSILSYMIKMKYKQKGGCIGY
jgi:hypothetical protein